MVDDVGYQCRVEVPFVAVTGGAFAVFVQPVRHHVADEAGFYGGVGNGVRSVSEFVDGNREAFQGQGCPHDELGGHFFSPPCGDFHLFLRSGVGGGRFFFVSDVRVSPAGLGLFDFCPCRRVCLNRVGQFLPCLALRLEHRGKAPKEKVEERFFHVPRFKMKPVGVGPAGWFVFPAGGNYFYMMKWSLMDLCS